VALQFFVGGLVLYVAALALLAGATADYDGMIGLISLAVFPLAIALASMIVTMVIGLPIRLVPGIRKRWLVNGEITVGGAVLGFLGCAIALYVAPVITSTDQYETAGARDANGWLLLTTWSLFAISVSHFVWPRRWTKPGQGSHARIETVPPRPGA
jgi:hypothetical protein